MRLPEPFKTGECEHRTRHKDHCCRCSINIDFIIAAEADKAISKVAKRCKAIAQQRYLNENQAVDIDKKISSEFGV